jgi:hypothetical protein
MITLHTPARLARLSVAVSTLTAMLLGWARTGDAVPESSPVLARRQLLDLGMAQALARDRMRERLEAELAAGRLSLTAAAKRLCGYLELEPKLEGLPAGRDCAALLPGATPEERCAHWLLRGVRKRLSGPGSAEQVARLEGELAAAYER